MLNIFIVGVAVCVGTVAGAIISECFRLARDPAKQRDFYRERVQILLRQAYHVVVDCAQMEQLGQNLDPLINAVALMQLQQPVTLAKTSIHFEGLSFLPLVSSRILRIQTSSDPRLPIQRTAGFRCAVQEMPEMTELLSDCTRISCEWITILASPKEWTDKKIRAEIAGFLSVLEQKRKYLYLENEIDIQRWNKMSWILGSQATYRLTRQSSFEHGFSAFDDAVPSGSYSKRFKTGSCFLRLDGPRVGSTMDLVDDLFRRFHVTHSHPPPVATAVTPATPATLVPVSTTQ